MELRGHARVDARSLAMHRAIAAKLRARPELIAIAHDNLERWSVSNPRQTSPFAGVLDPRERWAIYDEFAAVHPSYSRLREFSGLLSVRSPCFRASASNKGLSPLYFKN